MGDFTKQERAAIEAVARHFSATWEEGDGLSAAFITMAGKRVALEIAATKEQASSHRSRAKPRLRFDKVAVRVVKHLQDTLVDVAPEGVTVLLTITAPIRLPSKTAVALAEKIRLLLARRPEQNEEQSTIHGNHVRIRLEKSGSTPAAKVIGFVHNSDTDPLMLLDTTRSMLELFRVRAGTDTRKTAAGDRWLVVMSQSGSSHIDVYRYIYSQLGIPTRFNKILMAFGDGRVETLK